MTLPINPIKNINTPWVCLRDTHSKLVYFIHSKCACTFYKQLFFKLGWQTITTADVDWNNDIVFSYIRHPMRKHRTGILEWFYCNGLGDLLEEKEGDQKFLQMLSEIVYIDIHSMSIYDHLGDLSTQVQWIPLDQSGVDHKLETIKLLEKYQALPEDIKEWFLTLPPRHTSTGTRRRYLDKLLSMEPTALIIKYNEYDQCLYDHVITPTGFEPTNYSTRIQELKNKGLTQTEAEKIADSEVLTGDYKNWS